MSVQECEGGDLSYCQNENVKSENKNKALVERQLQVSWKRINLWRNCWLATASLSGASLSELSRQLYC